MNFTNPSSPTSGTCKRIELLAPAKDYESGCAVIDCGADAVYIGASHFGAREAAGNSLADIARLVAYAHRFYVQVYITLNTLLRDEEIEPAVRLCHELANVGVDGLIIQDLGLLECDLPRLPLIASTQMHNHTAERVAFWEQVGFSRVILARELTLQQIRDIRAATNVEIEVFVHGALCVCMSGQCYLSQAIGGRSGNRGQCAQPCRRSYTLSDDQGRTVATSQHLLSLRDLNLSDHLGDLLDAGVTSFKIEGRLKNKAYAMNIVGYYRERLDCELAKRGLQKSSTGSSQLGFNPNPHKTFNRGYTPYFLNGRGAKVASPMTPKHRGEPIGCITRSDFQSITIDPPQSLRGGDGITFFTGPSHLDGTVVNQVDGNRIYLQRPAHLPPGTRVFRNHDKEFISQLNQATPRRTIEIHLQLQENPDGFVLNAKDEDGVEATAFLNEPPVLAREAALATKQTMQHLAKLGDTIFQTSHISLNWKEPRFLPVAKINGLRRQLVDALQIAREKARIKPQKHHIHTYHPFPTSYLTYAGNILNSKAEDFYHRHGVTAIEPACEKGGSLIGRVVMTSKFCLKYERGDCPKTKKTAGALNRWVLTDDEGRGLALRFRCDLVDCVMEVIYGIGDDSNLG